MMHPCEYEFGLMLELLVFSVVNYVFTCFRLNSFDGEEDGIPNREAASLFRKASRAVRFGIFVFFRLLSGRER